MRRKLVSNTTWRAPDGVVHVAFWGQKQHGPWGYHQVCTGASLMQVDARSAYVEDGHPTCVACVAGT